MPIPDLFIVIRNQFDINRSLLGVVSLFFEDKIGEMNTDVN